MQIKDRIKRLDRIYAKDLIPNPKKWRVHPTAQADALKGILAEVGWADALQIRETVGERHYDANCGLRVPWSRS